MKTDDEKKRIRKNATSYYLQFGVTALCTLAISPILMSYMGAHLFGIWRVCQRIIEVFSFADGRVGQCLKFSIAANLAKGRSREDLSCKICAAYVFTARRYVIIFLITALFILLYLLMMPKEKYMAYSDYFPYAIAFVIFSMIGAFAAIPDAALTAAGFSYVSSAAQAFSSIVFLAGVYIYCEYSLPKDFVGITVVFSSAVCFFATVVGARKNINWYNSECNNKIIINKWCDFLKKLSINVSIWYGVEKLLLASDVLIIGWLAGATQVANYTFSSYVYQMGVSVSLLGTSARVPFLVRDIETGDRNIVRKRINEMRKRVLWVTSITALINLFLNEIFVKLWIGQSAYMGLGVDVILGLSLIQIGLLRCDCQVLDALGLFIEKSIIVFLMITISAIISAALFFGYDSTVLVILASTVAARIPFQLVIWIKTRAAWGG